MPAGCFHLISGPSSSGKSCFIQKLPETYDRVVFPAELNRLEVERGGSYLLHYNLLRPYKRRAKFSSGRALHRRVRGLALSTQMQLRNPFDTDAALRCLGRIDAEVRATVLAAPRAVLAERMRRRDSHELLVENGKAYPREEWLAILSAVNLTTVYRHWISFLRRENVPFEIVSSQSAAYQRLASEEDLWTLLADGE